MGLPRASRKPVVLSDEEENEDIDLTTLTEPDFDGESLAVPVTRSRSSHVSTQKAASKTTKKQPPAKRKAEPRKSPAKANVGKAKQDTRPSTTKPIYSFFNAATQRQTSLSESSASQEKPKSQAIDEAEAIHDDSEGGDDPGQVEFSTGSNTALAMRKRKDPLEQAADAPTATGLLTARQKFRKANDGSRTPSLLVENQDKRSWTDQFAPVDLTELAVHARKVRDVRQRLDTSFDGRRHKILVLKGSAGTGKTTTVHLLAKEMGFDVVEWRNPAGADLVAEGTAPAAAQFEEFIGRAGRAGSLTFASDGREAVIRDTAAPSRKQILLIEEFPSTFSRTSNALQSFRSALQQYVSSPPVPSGPPVPIILVISETLLSTNTSAADSFTAHRLLGPDLSIHPYVNTIEFNPIAPTILTKALELVILKEARKSGRRKGPGPQVIKHLVDTGDVRSAVSSLEFLCLRADDELWSTKIVFTKTKKTKNETALTEKEEEVLKLVSNRESTLGIFHAVGRVLYNNRAYPANAADVAQPPAWLPQHQRKKVPEKDINPLIDGLGTDTSTFVAALHENYLPSCGGATSEDMAANVSSCVDNLSDADLLSVDRFSYENRAFTGSATDSIRQDEMSFQVAARGMLFNLPHPVHRTALTEGRRGDAFRMYYPSSLRIWRQREEVETTLEHLTSRMSKGTLWAPLNNASRGVSGGSIGGVASWNRGRANQSNTPPSDDSGDAGNLLLGLSRSEVLTERLPCLAHILTSKAHAKQPSLLEQVQSVTRVQGQADLNADEDGEGAEGDSSNAAEQWSTDNPEAEGGPKKTQPQGLLKRRPKAETEGGGLAIPVEHSVENLVLQDDDISD